MQIANGQKSFGVVPLSPLTTDVGVHTNNDRCTDPLLVHQLVHASGCPNFFGLRIPILSNLNIPSWRIYLEHYWDQQIVDLLEFGFPLDFNRDSDLVSIEENHASAIQFTDMLRNILKKNCHLVLCWALLIKSLYSYMSPPSWQWRSRILTSGEP